MDRDEIVRILRAFDTVGLEYVLIGASAMGFHGIVRATEDLDLFIKATVDDVMVHVATPQALYRLKRGTVRPIDHQDAAALRQRFGLKDEA
ncbi:MAG: hypothetical protein EXQ50_05055 [Acidobacteria bacterium]|nr:hypothetical protein [Acidobacteriota bacterium]